MRLILVLTIIVTFFACKEENGLTISQEKITAMMGDMLLAEAAINRVNRGDSDSISALYYNQIYTIHNVDSTEFAKNLKLVAQDPNLSSTIYGAVEERMSGKLESLREEEKKGTEEKKEKKSAEDAKIKDKAPKKN